MIQEAILNKFLPDAPPAPCRLYDGGDTVMCVAKGKARNKFPLRTEVCAIAFQTDGEVYRFPPETNKGVCDWCVFTKEGRRGYFVELKGSNFTHAVEQLKSTIGHMRRMHGVSPQVAFAVLSGTHPANSRPGKANAKARFKNEFPNVDLRERSMGQARNDDIVF